MKETVNVSISGIAFILDTESYVLLSDYLQRLRTSLRDNPDSAEIVSDIESRIAELILTQQDPARPVSEGVIKNILDQLGELNSSAIIEDNTEPATEVKQESFPRRLYRNPDGAKIGGVCSGLGVYFGIDPVIIRLIFVLPVAFTVFWSWGHIFNWEFGMVPKSIGNTVVLLYLILWVAIPKAKTARQKLEMTGEPVTAEAIKETTTLRSQAKTPPTVESASSDIVSSIGRLIMVCVRIFVGFMGIIFTLTGIKVVIMTLAAFFFSTGIYIYQFNELASVTRVPLPYVIAITGALVIYPFLYGGYLLLAFAFKLPTSKTLSTILFTLWLILLITAGTFMAGNHIQWPEFHCDNLWPFRWIN